MACNNDCKNCKEKGSCEVPKYQMNHGTAKKTYAIVSGKGGVGKSSITSLLASTAGKKYKTGVLDADITGPSITKTFGINEKASGTQTAINPAKSANGVEIISTNMMLENPSDPVVWRGPIIAGVVKQFYEDVNWGDLDFLFIDMPPGTGDVPLTVFQSIPVDGIIIITSPQDLVQTIVEKAVKMANMMNIPIKGIIENYSYFHCPDNGKDYEIFGKSHVDEIAKNYNLDVLAKLPIDPEIAKLCDAGKIEEYQSANLDEIIEKLK